MMREPYEGKIMWEMDYDQAAAYWVLKDKEAVHMDDADLKEKIESFITEHNTCALATATREFVRCTPIEYNYLEGFFYMFSEGGVKFKGLKDNKHVGLAIYDHYDGFANLKSLQVEGIATIVEPFSEEYIRVLEHKKISVENIKKMPSVLNLIKVYPEIYNYLDSDLKEEGFGARQTLFM